MEGREDAGVDVMALGGCFGDIMLGFGRPNVQLVSGVLGGVERGER